MHCPNCQSSLRELSYEGAHIHTCDACGGEYIAPDAMTSIVNTREKRFPGAAPGELAAHKPVFGVPEAETRRVVGCPGCDGAMEVVNYGGDSGVFVDRCPRCGGLWLDCDELEKIQILMERWTDEAPATLRQFSVELEHARRQAAESVSECFTGSRFAFVNAIVNRVLDAA